MPLALAAFGGLCFLMWNTDGRMDWVASVCGLLASVASFAVAMHNGAVNDAYGAALKAIPDAANPIKQAVRDAITAQEFDPRVQTGLIATAGVLFLMPLFFKYARAAKVR